MNGWINALLCILTLALAILIVVRVRLKKRLDSIDGLVGITKRGAIQGKVIGGAMTKVYPPGKDGGNA